MWRGDFQERAGKGTADTRCYPKPCASGKTKLTALAAKQPWFSCVTPQSRGNAGEGACGPFVVADHETGTEERGKKCLGAKCWFKRD